MREAEFTLESREIYVLPNFISEGYFTQTVIPRELGLTGPLTQRADGRVWKYCEPAGNHASMTELLRQRAREVAPGVREEETSLLIVGHGTGLNDNSAVAAKAQAALIREQSQYVEVLSTFMEEEPLIARWDELTTAPNVVVVPFFIADGLHSYQDIPVLLGLEAELPAAASQSAVFRRNPRVLRGRNLYYAAAIGTEPRFVDVMLDLVTAFDRKHGPN